MDSEVEPLASGGLSANGRTIAVSVEFGDARNAFGDVLLLKHAQRNYGLDLEVVNALSSQQPDLLARLPVPGDTLALRAPDEGETAFVLFIGTPTLDRFGYNAARAWARTGLSSLGDVRGRVATVVTTVQGVNIGDGTLDEQLLFRKQIAGFHDAVAFGRVRSELKAIRIVERDSLRAKRLADQLPDALAAAAGPQPITDGDLSRTVASVRSELDPNEIVTAGALAAGVQKLHPEYAGNRFGRVTFDESAGESDAVDGWLQRVAELYPTATGEVLDGRQLVAGLIKLDPHVRDAMDQADLVGDLEAEMSSLPRTPYLRENVDWEPDEPTSDDKLGRRLVAKELARQLAAFDDQHPGRSFMFLIDGRWGAGKSTLVRFLREEAEQEHGFRVSEFDAWRQSRSGPPWLLLMTTLRDTLSNSGDLSARVRLLDRMRWIGTANIVAAIVTVVVLVGIVIAWVTGWADPEGSTAAVVAALAFIAVLWPAARAIGHLLTLDSVRGARRFIETRPDPMEDISQHFDWLRGHSPHPNLLIVDDLDRCDADYVVELLDNIQKLVRPSAHNEHESTPTLFIGVAADARWLREAYQSAHGNFADAIDEPGRPLGSLFIDKLFQLRVPVPELSPELQQALLVGMLGPGGESPGIDGLGEAAAVEIDAARRLLDSSETSEDVLEQLRSMPASVRLRVADDALDRLTSGGPSGLSEADHALERFAPLLEPNPRSVLRFTMAFSILRAARTAEGSTVSADELALWTIVSVRWPLLAEFLGRRPAAVGLF